MPPMRSAPTFPRLHLSHCRLRKFVQISHLTFVCFQYLPDFLCTKVPGVGG